MIRENRHDRSGRNQPACRDTATGLIPPSGWNDLPPEPERSWPRLLNLPQLGYEKKERQPQNRMCW